METETEVGGVSGGGSAYSLELGRICRSCMRDERELVDLFSGEDDWPNPGLVEMYTQCASVQVVKEDGLPQKVCMNCIESIRAAYSFRSQCEANDTILRDILKSQNSSVLIKQEPDVESLLDDMKQEYDDEFDDSLPNDDDSSTSRSADTRKKKKKIRGKHSCTECDKQFSKASKLMRHLKVHIKIKKESPHECEVCKKTFLKLSGLNRHMAIHDSEAKPFECSGCFQRFKREGLLLRHVTIHTTGIDTQTSQNTQVGDNKEGVLQKYQCEDCVAVFDSRHSLSSHMRIHKEKMKQKSYMCTVCGKRFSSKNPLNRHMKLHSEEKPHKCNLCEKSYSRQDQLLDHINKHNGIKPNVCSFCNKGMSCLQLLKLGQYTQNLILLFDHKQIIGSTIQPNTNNVQNRPTDKKLYTVYPAC